MTDPKARLLAENVAEFYTQGKFAFSKGAYNSAVSLFFKALAVLADWHVLRVQGFVPKSHAERFRILEQRFKSIYAVLDKDFPAYQDSYKIKVGKDVAEVLLDDAERLAKEVGFPL